MNESLKNMALDPSFGYYELLACPGCRLRLKAKNR
jgi:PHP family Zn ribbon phosphoesterase